MTCFVVQSMHDGPIPVLTFSTIGFACVMKRGFSISKVTFHWWPNTVIEISYLVMDLSGVKTNSQPKYLNSPTQLLKPESSTLMLLLVQWTAPITM